ncbi:MAG: hypothetical protein CL843_09535 [Crocinitomicaceae bacterium]|nr:hypothetical protein [Crocinitomicaceae bacterium]
MSIYQHFNFQDDDSTESLNLRDLGILPHGLYRGFDAVMTNSMVLELNHASTGLDQVLSDNVTTETVGVVRSKQGAIIRSSDTHLVQISAADPNLPRIDLVVVEFEYEQIQGGGNTVIYSIDGTPASSPVSPSLTFPTKQVIIGELYIPSGVNSLNDSGVNYTRPESPFFNDDPIPSDIARLNEEQSFTKLQSFAYLAATYNSSQYSIDIQSANTNLLLLINSTTEIRFISNSLSGTILNFIVDLFGSGTRNFKLIHDYSGTIPSGYSKLYIPGEKNIEVADERGSFEVIKTSTDYYYLGHCSFTSPKIGDWINVGDTNAPAPNIGWKLPSSSVYSADFLRFRKDLRTGKVDIQGAIEVDNTGPLTLGATMFTLPSEYTSSVRTHIQATIYQLVGSSNEIPVSNASCQILPSGEVQVFTDDTNISLVEGTIVSFNTSFTLYNT